MMTSALGPVVIVGMHRSGTSSLAGSLQQKGLFLGKVFEQNPHNRKGNRENAQITSLNDTVLNTSGGSWDNPPQALSWVPQQAKQRDCIIHAFTSNQNLPWGFKDPRTLLTLRFWQEGLPNLRLLGTFRHPELVASSLYARSRMPKVQALDLWRVYNIKLLKCLEERDFPLVSFDVSLEEYHGCIERVAACFGIADGEKEEKHFFEPTLRNHTLEGNQQIPEEVGQLYDKLNQIYQRQRDS